MHSRASDFASPGKSEIGSPNAIQIGVRLSGNQLFFEYNRSLPTITHGKIGTPAICANVDAPARNGAPSSNERAPSRMPPSGKSPTIRPCFSRSMAVRMVLRSARCRSAGNASTARKRKPSTGSGKNSAIAIQSILRRTTEEIINGSKWLM